MQLRTASVALNVGRLRGQGARSCFPGLHMLYNRKHKSCSRTYLQLSSHEPISRLLSLTMGSLLQLKPSKQEVTCKAAAAI